MQSKRLSSTWYVTQMAGEKMSSFTSQPRHSSCMASKGPEGTWAQWPTWDEDPGPSTMRAASNRRRGQMAPAGFRACCRRRCSPHLELLLTEPPLLAPGALLRWDVGRRHGCEGSAAKKVMQ
jgi:hypothetical protein